MKQKQVSDMENCSRCKFEDMKPCSFCSFVHKSEIEQFSETRDINTVYHGFERHKGSRLSRGRDSNLNV